MCYQFRIDEEFNLNTVFFPVWDNTSVSTIQLYFIVLHLQNLTGYIKISYLYNMY